VIRTQPCSSGAAVVAGRRADHNKNDHDPTLSRPLAQ
jgi:hypothetical protein